MTDSHRRGTATALLVAGCFFMEMLDGTIVSTAAPQIARDLHTAPTSVGLVITAYLVTLAVLIPLSGWLTARFGPRRVFLTAITVFTLASLACAFAPNLGALVGTRVLQGVGGAMMVPVGRLIVLTGTAKRELPRMVAYIVWPGLVAPVLAPLLGGLITTYASWHWIFLLNVPLGVVALLVAHRLIAPAPRDETPLLDLVGTLLTCTGLAALTWTAHLLSDPAGGARARTVAVGALAAVALAAAVRHLLRTPHPLVNLRTLDVQSFRASALDGSLYMAVVAALPFLLPLLFQEVFGWSAVKSGAVVLFVFVGNIGVKPATTYLINRFGFRPLLIVSTLGLAVTTVACALFTRGTPVAVIAVVAVLSGVARSVGLSGYATIAFSETPPERLRDANALFATSHQLAAGLGVAVTAVALRGGAALTDGTRSAYAVAFVVLGVLCLVPTAGALRLHPAAGDAARTVVPAQGRVTQSTVSDSRKSD
ncbi:DHA2 family efflux MFS transporter permease subunit [Streptomyces mirabilis]|uniref:DHA2 family efflux MFS transporter permease subunit n=1 Tax=Streptomyces mirabilis TaxID=68239 RepID=A0ABU3UK34_9ACTN|nr:DHA2 family efflux MFS transporter permease subunit [Streptomyces mirabilis]MDU8994279.1 DHA2 family efflux MFS transporter permease subunit [Streptomyces mirabilis]